MKKIMCVVGGISLLFSGYTLADHDDDYHSRNYDYARVTHVEPVYRTVYHDVPTRRCYHDSPRRHYGHSGRHGYKRYSSHRHEPHRDYYHHSSATPTIVGAVIGGAIGNAIGHNKSNKKVGTAVGAILGGAIAHDIAHADRGYHSHYTEHAHHRPYSRKRCTVSYEYSETTRELRGYNVTYRYKGERYHTFTHEHPGHRIRVKINVTPAIHGE